MPRVHGRLDPFRAGPGLAEQAGGLDLSGTVQPEFRQPQGLVDLTPGEGADGRVLSGGGLARGLPGQGPIDRAVLGRGLHHGLELLHHLAHHGRIQLGGVERKASGATGSTGAAHLLEGTAQFLGIGPTLAEHAAEHVGQRVFAVVGTGAVRGIRHGHQRIGEP
ncbi:hypothetical protein CITRIK5_50086 [Citricoccus sp. K5]|nr:hypothetical protein CITRIK5_50086 [Citricoccus sp. K5]